MNKRELGQTGISSTCMGLGLAALGRPGYINLGHGEDIPDDYQPKLMEKHCHQVLDFAWSKGIRYFDAARSYGRAEEFLASWLHSRQIKASDVTVGSKWGYTYTADWSVDASVHEVKEHSVEVLKRQWQESRRLLSGWLKLYQIHSATMDSGVLQNNKLLQILAQMKSEQIAIGLSLSGVNQAATLERAMAIEIDGRRLFDVVQATWNVLEISAGKMLGQAHQQGMGVIIKEGVANGRLTGRNDEKDFKEKKIKLVEIAEENHCTIDAVVLAYILKQPWVDIVLSGAATREHLEANLAASGIKSLPEINIAEEPQTYWSKRSALSWN